MYFHIEETFLKFMPIGAFFPVNVKFEKALQVK